MRWLIWVGFALVWGVWTAGVAVAAQLLGWLASVLGAGDGGNVAQAVQAIPWPAWLLAWVDRAWLDTMATAVAQSWAWLTKVLPVAATVAGWLVPLAWVVWGLVTAVLLAGAIGLHWLVGRLPTHRTVVWGTVDGGRRH